MRCRDVNNATYNTDLWDEIHGQLTYLHGAPRLSGSPTRSQADDAITFLQECSDRHFLDFIELLFRTNAFFHASSRFNLVDDFNQFFRVDDLPYEVTQFVWTSGVEKNAFGAEHEVTRLTEYPQVIRKDSQVTFDTAIAPALALLRGNDFVLANKEFLAALEDYRKGEYGDCLTKCGSAFESVLKVLCARRRWPFNPTDTAATLLHTVVARSGLEPFLEQPLLLVATMRNRLSTSHGAGSQPRVATAAKAEYTINATAAAILLLSKAAE